MNGTVPPSFESWITALTPASGSPSSAMTGAESNAAESVVTDDILESERGTCSSVVRKDLNRVSPSGKVRVMSTLSYRTIQTSRMRQRVAEEGQGDPVILLHGFPEGAYSFRHQLPALARAGFRAIAPDQRGYDGAELTHEIDAYDHVELALDVIALMDTLGI